MAYKIEKSWYSQDYYCVIIMTEMGHRCGYVGIPSSHSLHGIGYNEPTYKLAPYWEVVAGQRMVTMECLMNNLGPINVFCSGPQNPPEPSIAIGVHGGITFSNGNGKHPIPMKDYWWFGYDCAHAGDALDLSVLPEETRKIYEQFPKHGVLRSIKYCFYECIKLADQLRNVQEEYEKRKEILSRKF